MTWTKLETCAIALVVCLFVTASAGGSKGYGDECIIGVLAGVGVGNEADTCNDDKHLMCLGKTCKCSPEYVYQNGWLGLEFLGGGCKVRANFPCSESGTGCVTNSHCKTICQCDEGYRMNLSEGSCTNGAVKNVGLTMIPLFLLGLLFCHFQA